MQDVPTSEGLVGGRYALEAMLGTGGMGEVWRARHVALNTLVAIKFLHGPAAHRPSSKKRFLTEAQIAAQLKTRHAVQVFDFGIRETGQPYLVMELLEGETLGHRIEQRKKIPFAMTCRLLEEAARALERAHGLGIVHRDFKPDNVVIVRDEEGAEHVKVLDFGVAKLLNDLDAKELVDESSPDITAPRFDTSTHSGMILGTPLYMSPEQVRNADDLDLRADIWAFGVVAYQCVTGAPPFRGRNIIHLFERILTGSYTPAHAIAGEVPSSFDEWFRVACAIDPAKRFPSARLAAEELAIALGLGAPDSLNASFDLKPLRGPTIAKAREIPGDSIPTSEQRFRRVPSVPPPRAV